MKDARAHARQAFIEQQGWGGCVVQALAADASFRRYFRLSRGEERRILMDAPPPQEDIRPFVAVAEHLQALGQHPPAILAQDVDAGFALLEDLGEQTFTRLLDAGVGVEELYPMALERLLTLHCHPENASLAVPEYDRTVTLNEVALLVDWYLPALTGRLLDPAARQGWLDAWAEVFAALPSLVNVLVLRDFHVDNLMRPAPGVCALLDFQDALIGSPAYDLASLLEDARRDLPETLRTELQAAYLAARPELDAAVFDQHYRVWAAQRHAKVLGIFLRLWLRDGKPVYLAHIPRVLALLQRRLGDAELAPVSCWLARELPEFGQPLSEADALCGRYAQACESAA